MIEVEAPDGTIVEFPDDMGTDAIAAVMRKQWPAQSQAQPQKPVSIGQSVGRGLLDAPRGMTQGLLNAGYSPGSQARRFGPYDEGDDAGVMELPGQKSPNLAQKINQDIRTDEAAYQGQRRAAGQGFDWGRLGGNILGTLPFTGLLGAPAKTLGGAALQGAGTGATMGAMQPVTGDSYATEKAAQIGWGAVAGGVFQPLVTLIGKFISPTVSKETKLLMDKGVTPLPGQMIGETAAKIESASSSINPAVAAGQRRAIDEFNRAAYNEVLSDVGESLPKTVTVGREAVKEVGDILGKKYDDLLPNLVFGADEKLLADTTALKQMVAGLPKKEQRYFNSFFDDKLKTALAPNGAMDGIAYKEIESALSAEARSAAASTDIYQRKLGTAFETLLDSMEDALERINPDYAPTLQAINRSWAKLVPLEHAAKGIKEGGRFTPAQLLQGIRTASDTVRKRGFTRGTGGALQDLGEAGQKVLGNQYPDSGTAGRAVLGALTLGGTSMVSPVGAGVLAGSMLGYTPIAQRGFAGMMTARPQAAPQIAAGLNRAVTPATAALAAALAGKPVPNRSNGY